MLRVHQKFQVPSSVARIAFFGDHENSVRSDDQVCWDDEECGVIHLEDTQLKKAAGLLHCGSG